MINPAGYGTVRDKCYKYRPVPNPDFVPKTGSPKKSPKKQSKTSNFVFKDETVSEFFIGGLNKQKTRDELFRELSGVKLRNGEKIYIRRFNMPKINAYRDGQNRLICTPGYAFVTTRYAWMAQELIKSGQVLLNGQKAEIKSIQAVKRLNSKKNELEKKRAVRLRLQNQVTTEVKSIFDKDSLFD